LAWSVRVDYSTFIDGSKVKAPAHMGMRIYTGLKNQVEIPGAMRELNFELMKGIFFSKRQALSITTSLECQPSSPHTAYAPHSPDTYQA
jgi:hypothetical protein